jgi:hypothetical protein
VRLWTAPGPARETLQVADYLRCQARERLIVGVSSGLPTAESKPDVVIPAQHCDIRTSALIHVCVGLTASSEDSVAHAPRTDIHVKAVARSGNQFVPLGSPTNAEARTTGPLA